MFAHSSVQNCSSSVKLNGECWWTAIFKSCHRFLIGFKSGLWLGHSRTFIFLFLSHSSVALAVCFGSLSCWRWTSIPISAFLQRAAGFPLGLLHPFSILSWQVPLSLLMRNIPVTWCCHHHASQLGWCSLGDMLCWVCAKRLVLHFSQKVQFSKPYNDVFMCAYF